MCVWLMCGYVRKLRRARTCGGCRENEKKTLHQIGTRIAKGREQQREPRWLIRYFKQDCFFKVKEFIAVRNIPPGEQGSTRSNITKLWITFRVTGSLIIWLKVSESRYFSFENTLTDEFVFRFTRSLDEKTPALCRMSVSPIFKDRDAQIQRLFCLFYWDGFELLFTYTFNME